MAEPIHQSALLTPDQEADRETLFEEYQLFLQQGPAEKLFAPLVRGIWLGTRSSTNSRNELDFLFILSHYSSGGLLFRKIILPLKRQAAKSEKELSNSIELLNSIE